MIVDAQCICAAASLPSTSPVHTNTLQLDRRRSRLTLGHHVPGRQQRLHQRLPQRDGDPMVSSVSARAANIPAAWHWLAAARAPSPTNLPRFISNIWTI
eukprot:7740746-Pyramimonas_sp.AAC.1